MNFTKYNVQVLENGIALNIPHTDGIYCDFLDKKKAIKFMDLLKYNSPKEKFRIVKIVETRKYDNWI